MKTAGRPLPSLPLAPFPSGSSSGTESITDTSRPPCATQLPRGEPGESANCSTSSGSRSRRRLTMHRVSALLPSWDRSRQPTPAASAASITTPTSPTAISPTTTSPTTTTPISAPKTPRALDKVFGWAGKVAVPASRNSSPAAAATSLAPARYGRETYWPTTLDKECDKAARIIKSFCCMSWAACVLFVFS